MSSCPREAKPPTELQVVVGRVLRLEDRRPAAADGRLAGGRAPHGELVQRVEPQVHEEQPEDRNEKARELIAEDARIRELRKVANNGARHWTSRRCRNASSTDKTAAVDRAPEVGDERGEKPAELRGRPEGDRKQRGKVRRNRRGEVPQLARAVAEGDSSFKGDWQKSSEWKALSAARRNSDVTASAISDPAVSETSSGVAAPSAVTDMYETAPYKEAARSLPAKRSRTGGGIGGAADARTN